MLSLLGRRATAGAFVSLRHGLSPSKTVSAAEQQLHSVTRIINASPKSARAPRLGLHNFRTLTTFTRSRVNEFLGREYTPSKFMIRARRFSKEANDAAKAAGEASLSFPKRHPFATNIIIATVKTSLCDILVQKYIEDKKDIDWMRVSVFTAFGCLYLGFFQWAMYVTLFARLFPGMAKFANMPFKEKIKDTRGMLNVVGQSVFDNFVHYTFIYFPVFYTFKEAIQGTGYEKSVGTVLDHGLGKYKTNFWEDNYKMWALWVPGDLIIYAVPMWLRLPLNHALSFIWTCYLSFLRGDKIEEDADKSTVEQTVIVVKKE